MLKQHVTPDLKIDFRSFDNGLKQLYKYISMQELLWRAQWLSGRVLDWRPSGHGFEPHRRHCVVVLEQDTFNPNLVLAQPRKTRPCLTERLLMRRKESNQTNKSKKCYLNMVFNLTKPKLSPYLFACRYIGKHCGFD